MEATFAEVERTHLVSGLEIRIKFVECTPFKLKNTASRCNSASSQLHIELFTNDTLRSDFLSKIFLYAWIFSFD